MKKNKKLLTVIVITLIITTILLMVCIYFVNKKQNTVDNVDMEALNTEITTEGNFDETRFLTITKDNVSTLFGVPIDAVIEVIGRYPLINTKSGMFVVINVVDGKVDMVKEKLEEYGKTYEEQWSSYIEDQYELVKDRKIGNKSNYVYMIVADEPEKIVDLIK